MGAIARARGWLYDVFAHHHAENLRTQRAIHRRTMGVETLQDLPYPGQGSANTVSNEKISGWLPGALVGAALLAGGGLAAVGISKLASPPASTSVSGGQGVASGATGAPGGGWDVILERQNSDGTWKEVDRQKIRQNTMEEKK